MYLAEAYTKQMYTALTYGNVSGRLVDLSFTGYTMAECALFKKSHGHHGLPMQSSHHGLPMQSELAVLLPEHTYTKRKAMVSLAGKTVVRKSAQQSTRQLRPLAPFAPPSPRRLWVVHGHLFGRWALVRCGEATGYSQVEATQPRPSQTRAKPPLSSLTIAAYCTVYSDFVSSSSLLS